MIEVGHYRICTDEPAHSGQVVPRTIVIQTARVRPLPGEFLIRVQRAAGVPGRAVRVIPRVSILSARAVRYHAGAAQMVVPPSDYSLKLLEFCDFCS